jgi:hypothetical protein
MGGMTKEADDAAQAAKSRRTKARLHFASRVHELASEPPWRPAKLHSAILTELLAYAATWIDEAAGPLEGEGEPEDQKGIVAYRNNKGWRYAIVPKLHGSFLAYQLDEKTKKPLPLPPDDSAEPLGGFSWSRLVGPEQVQLNVDDDAANVLETTAKSIPETLSDVRDVLLKAGVKRLRGG